jgi:hypothetical protein
LYWISILLICSLLEGKTPICNFAACCTDDSNVIVLFFAVGRQNTHLQCCLFCKSWNFQHCVMPSLP